MCQKEVGGDKDHVIPFLGGVKSTEVLNLVNMEEENGEGRKCGVAGGVVAASRKAEGGKSDTGAER